jgi:ElaB/YqjD/DUF883 family membrane-anchored ribosome-binding protein
LAKPINAGAVMRTDSLISHELKTLKDELSASQKKRAVSPVAGAAPQNMVGPASAPSTANGLHDQVRQFADELKGLFDRADNGISAHPTQSVVGAMLVGILIGRLLGRR